MITEYFDGLLFDSLIKIHFGKYDGPDFNESMLPQFLNYSEAFLDTEEHPSTSTTRYFNMIWSEPRINVYNLMVGYTSDNVLVFIKEVNVDITNKEVGDILIKVIKLDPDSGIDFDISIADEGYQSHSHAGIAEFNSVNPISKFTNYMNELTNDEIYFSDGRVLGRMAPSNSMRLPYVELRVGRNAISNLSGIFGVDFRFELMPSTVISTIRKNSPNFSIINGNVTYRGNVICYLDRTVGLGKYYLLYKEGNEFSARYEFDDPITLITETFVAIFKDNAWRIHEHKILTGSNTGRSVSEEFIDTGLTCDYILYRGAYRVDGGREIRLI